MTGNEQISRGETGRGRFIPVLGLFAAGVVHSVLPHGMFGTYDFAASAAIVGTVAGVTTLVLSVLTKRRAAR